MRFIKNTAPKYINLYEPDIFDRSNAMSGGGNEDQNGPGSNRKKSSANVSDGGGVEVQVSNQNNHIIHVGSNHY